MVILKSQLVRFFSECMEIFFKNESELILIGIAERTLCGSLSITAHNLLSKYRLKGYYSHVEFNRMQEGRVKTMINEKMEYISINCDLIIHSNGKLNPDNLLALEMKKSGASPAAKRSDRNRLIALTKTADQDVWPEDGRARPEHVCGYLVGYYMELNLKTRNCIVDRYELGVLVNHSVVKL